MVWSAVRPLRAGESSQPAGHPTRGHPGRPNGPCGSRPPPDRVQSKPTPGRLRFSIAHEIAHTLFPDCQQHVRNRAARAHMKDDDWQLEMLCNVAAAELLMPIGSFPDLKDKALSVDALMALQRQYDVSTEALLLRVVRLTDDACA